MSETKIVEEQEEVVEQGVHNYSGEEQWVKPEDPLLLERLEWFKDQKLGLMMHWGPYSQLGIVESWALSDTDEEWSRNEIDWDVDAEELKRQYFGLNKTFNPLRFQPELWADLAAENGFKYLNFTTKHHDGFCMWDTHTTDYRITGPDCPFHTHKYADICKQLFDAFRARGLAISAYFSKADWHTPYYWAPGMERGNVTSRGPSYDPKEYPHLWEQFVQFTHKQIMELMTRYGRIDMLWLDAGWVNDYRDQNIRLGEVVDKAREYQPWLLSADRTVGGPYENLITPEQTLPDRPLNVPWESCITMGYAFSYRYEDQYKSVRQLIHLLIEIVAKGGNLALNVAPQPDGRLSPTAISRIKGMGAWLKVYGEGIYGTRSCEPYSAHNCQFTRKDDIVYAFYLYKDEQESVQEELHIPIPQAFSQIDLVGGQDNLQYRRTDNGIIVLLPENERLEQAPIAHVFRIK
ncbi:alpha-L-fucosidase [Paenibacillus sp. FSL H8-0548]|uniref:alpha-L-fucosidase n=1 Tax=Paenibacillus sp. FSL H8-0548 TaxID=1920422 RepID=UPI00096ECAA4|nr:alpha-L-fucosidase [Paenibacillus sp. FSL H8-0548]OMF24961.1 alpha-L-fucosidase [Paenibacillus sp. FSL H8-0548]